MILRRCLRPQGPIPRPSRELGPGCLRCSHIMGRPQLPSLLSKCCLEFGRLAWTRGRAWSQPPPGRLNSHLPKSGGPHCPLGSLGPLCDLTHQFERSYTLCPQISGSKVKVVSCPETILRKRTWRQGLLDHQLVS